jgi:hypothetical protein
MRCGEHMATTTNPAASRPAEQVRARRIATCLPVAARRLVSAAATPRGNGTIETVYGLLSISYCLLAIVYGLLSIAYALQSLQRPFRLVLRPCTQ